MMFWREKKKKKGNILHVILEIRLYLGWKLGTWFSFSEEPKRDGYWDGILASSEELSLCLH